MNSLASLVLHFSLAIAVLFSSAVSGRASAADAKATRPPNVIFIMTDDLGYGDLGCYGQKKIRTPHIDALAAQGMKFTQYYAGSAVCAPSRCVLLTGLHSGHAYIRDNYEVGKFEKGAPEGQMPLPADTTTIGTLFKQKGYTTGCIGKWGLGGPGSTGEPNHQGFDHFFGYLCQRVAHNLYPTHLWRNRDKVVLEGNEYGNLVGKQYSHDLMTDEALAFVKQNKDKPFFLYLAWHIPHLALQVPEDSMEEYHKAFGEETPYDGKKGYLPHKTPRAALAGMITRLDRDTGRLMALLKELNLDENTIVFFTSDNGGTWDLGGVDPVFFANNGILRGFKGSMYEGGLRVPMIVRWPGHIKAGSVSDHQAAHWDVMPTLMELIGAAEATPKAIDGISFAPTLLAREGQKQHDHLYWELGRRQGIRKSDWKAVRPNPGQPIQLFNLKDDVSETKDVASQHPQIVAEMRELLKSSRTDSKEFPVLNGK